MDTAPQIIALSVCSVRYGMIVLSSILVLKGSIVTMNTEIIIRVTQTFASDAEEFGLLEEAVIKELLEQELERRIADLVNQEIHAYRDEKRQLGTDIED